MTFEKISDTEVMVTAEDYKISADPKPFKITFHEDDVGIRLIAESTTSADAKALALDARILGYLAEHRDRTPRRYRKP